MQTPSVKHQIVDHPCIYQPENIPQSRSSSQRRQTSCCDIFTNNGTKRIQQRRENRNTQKTTTWPHHAKLPGQTVETRLRIRKGVYPQVYKSLLISQTESVKQLLSFF